MARCLLLPLDLHLCVHIELRLIIDKDSRLLDLVAICAFDHLIDFSESVQGAVTRLVVVVTVSASRVQVLKHATYLFIARQARLLHLCEECVNVILQFFERVPQDFLFILCLLLARLLYHLVLPDAGLDLVLDLVRENFLHVKISHHFIRYP